MPGVLALLASALLAGCGVGGGSTTATTPAAPAPVVSGGGVQDATGSGGSGGNGRAAGTVSGGGPAGRFSTAKTGSFGHASASFSSAKPRYGHVPPSSVITGSRTPPAAAPPAPSRPAAPPAPARPKRVARPRPATRPVVRTRTVIIYVTRFKFRTVYRERRVTQTVIKTVTKTKNPNVPAGAFLPSTHPVLAQASFTVSGGNVGCRLSPGTVRCGVERRTWAPPVQPVSCSSTWGDTIGLPSTGPPQFVCGGSSPIDPAAKVIPSGYDDTVGQITCQIRSFGVNCFNAKSRGGFVISRTGYALY